MKYYGKWSAGTTYTYIAYESTNKNKLIAEMRKMAYGNRQASRTCDWQVWFVDENGEKQLVANGGISYTGRKWREDYE